MDTLGSGKRWSVPVVAGIAVLLVASLLANHRYLDRSSEMRLEHVAPVLPRLAVTPEAVGPDASLSAEMASGSTDWTQHPRPSSDTGSERAAAVPARYTRMPKAVVTEGAFGGLGALDSAEWSQLAHDPQRTGYVPYEVPGPWQFKWIWNGPVGGGDAGPSPDHLRLPKGVQPVCGDGRLYVGHSDGVVRAISETTGDQVWFSPLDGPIINAGAFDGETGGVYFGSTDGWLYLLSASDGQVLDSFEAGGEIVMAPLLVSDTIYIGSTNGDFYALDKTTLNPQWPSPYAAGAALLASPAYSANYEGLVIILSEDKFVHAIQVSDGNQRWQVEVNADEDPIRGNTSFADTYPVVSEANDVVIVRPYLEWWKMWEPGGGAPATVAEIRSYLEQNPTLQSFFALELDDGAQRFVAPVMVGAIGNGDDFESVPPQAVVKELADGSEVAYLLWRSGQSCSPCDGRGDTTVGEMDLNTGYIRFVQDYKNDGTMRFPTDEQGPLSMADDTLFHANWLVLGSVRITDRSPGLGDSYDDPIAAEELTPAINTLDSERCSGRDSSNHYCPEDMGAPGNSFRVDPGFYVYYYDQRVYDLLWETPVRSAVISNGSIYWRTVDGAILALQTEGTPVVPQASKSSSPSRANYGETITFTISLTGIGQPITVTDQLAPQVDHLSPTTTCPGSVSYDDPTREVTYSGSPALGENCAIEIATQVASSEPMLLTNEATVYFDPGPPFPLSSYAILNGFHVYLPAVFRSY